MPHVQTLIETVLKETADSLNKAMEVYWAADVAGANDLPERNLSMHFAHQLMCNDFYLYAEANHQDKKIQGIDILAISPDFDYYIACEFKKYFGHTMDYSLDDIDRVRSYTLDRNFADKLMVYRRKETLKKCKKGYGLVAGLTWVSGAKPEINLSKSSNHKPFEDRVRELGGKVLKPIPLDMLEEGGNYFLLSALLDVEC